jgi:Arc/MetJ-type ribon-helix-helix transcriptional regulator
MATVNISLPQGMYDDARQKLIEKRYTSISELMRDALRRLLYQNISENGFTQEFEDQVLQSSVESGEKDITWETEADIDSYFQNLEKKIVK